MAVDDKFIIQQQGRDFVLFAGLLNEAHERGLKSITTEVVKLVMEGDNPAFALVKARVELEGGAVFEGYGDANAQNVNRNVGKHLLRMAETRAKARALRDAVNIGMTAFDEVGGDDEQPASERGSERRRDTRSRRDASKGSATTLNGNAGREPQGATGNEESGKLTPEQYRRISALAKDFYPDGLRELQRKALKGKQVSRLSPENADKVIAGLQREISERDYAASNSEMPSEDFDDVDFDEDLGDIDSYSRKGVAHG